MPRSDPQYDPIFEQVARSSAHTAEDLWRNQGLAMPPGLAERFGQVAAEFLRNRKEQPTPSGVSIGMTRLLDLVRAAADQVPGGERDPDFLNVFAKMFRD